MRTSDCIACKSFDCVDVKHDCHLVPSVTVKSETISLVMISEAVPENPNDYYYAKGKPLFQETTVQAFCDAGVKVSSVRELISLGVYLTTAVKCAKTEYGIRSETVQNCSRLLERELALFPRTKVLMLMGDVAIKAMNMIAQRNGQKRVIPSGSTYKLRSDKYFYNGIRVFPSYLQAGPSFFIEKSKRRMIAEDIAAAIQIATA